jgi:hypothetical protein
MNKFNREMGEEILKYILITSTRESEQYIKDQTKLFVEKGFTDRELYDYIDDIGKIPVDRFEFSGTKVCVGDISGFTQKLCELSLYYERPSE